MILKSLIFLIKGCCYNSRIFSDKILISSVFGVMVLNMCFMVEKVVFLFICWKVKLFLGLLL